MKKNLFNSVLLPTIKSNKFDLSHDVKLSFKMGQLIPTSCFEALPGDVFKISVENMLRFSALIAPVMHKVDVITEYFFVPNRLLWADWEGWIMEKDQIQAPFINLTSIVGFEQSSLADYLGYPVGTPNPGNAVKVSPMPLAAYRLIYDEYYRSQQIQDEFFVPLVAGDNDAAYGVSNAENIVRNRCWQHDYFTACLPNSQQGDAVQIPLVDQGKIPVTPNYTAGNPEVKHMATGTDAHAGDLKVSATGEFQDAVGDNVTFDFNGSQEVDIQADATDINTLRLAVQVQKWLEVVARTGQRYKEGILGHFGVNSKDSRLQRPEFIGASYQNMVISTVFSTAQTNDSETGDILNPVAQMAGSGISVGGGNTFSYRATEHGYVIGIISVRPKTAYQQGLHKSLTRFDPLDYAWPVFAHIGEQAVLNKELYLADTEPEGVFGYVPRHAEYKFINSRVAGSFRGNLSYWHLGRIFDTEQRLNSDFLTCDPSERIFAIQGVNSEHIYAHVFNNVLAIRKLPRYGVPQFGG